MVRGALFSFALLLSHAAEGTPHPTRDNPYLIEAEGDHYEEVYALGPLVEQHVIHPDEWFRGA